MDMVCFQLILSFNEIKQTNIINLINEIILGHVLTADCKMDANCRRKQATVIDSLVKVRRMFSFAHPVETIQVMDHAFYGSNTWRHLEYCCSSLQDQHLVGKCNQNEETYIENIIDSLIINQMAFIQFNL